MSAWDDIKKGSPDHKVKHLSGRAFRIFPISESAKDLKRFQSVARGTIALAAAEGRYCLPRLIDRHSLDGYISVVIGENNSSS